MKYLRQDGARFELEFAPEERQLLLHLLGFYPLVPESYHRVTKDRKLARRLENQQMLDEAMKAQRDKNKLEVQTLINEPERFKEQDGACRVRLERGELEWLLQVLNDIRIGSWIALGSPGYEKKPSPPKDKDAARNLMFMELAGAFEMFFLGILNGDVMPESLE